MLSTKGRNTSTNSMVRVVLTRPSRRLPRLTNTPACWNPFITAIKLNSSAKVSQSM